MIAIRPTFIAFLCALVFVVSVQGADDSFRAPDSIVLKNGKVVKGLIIKNTPSMILMQEEFGENSYPKSEIVRVRDEANINMEFTDVHRKGDLPAWRVIANDLRSNDRIKSLVEIPATMIDNGQFKNVPYKSFRVNDNIELNIYGDPNDPAGIEMGIYGWRSGVPKLRKILRAYLAGFLSCREEIAALYGLPFSGGVKDTKDLTVEITPKSAPDAYGAWWISIYNKARLNKDRLSDAEYKRLTLPFNEVVDRRGRVRNRDWSDQQLGMSTRLNSKSDPVLLKGFYRDRNGGFRLITEAQPARSKTPATATN